MGKKVLVVFSVLFLILCVLVFRPVPIIYEDQALEVSGVVEKIKHTEGDDYVFKLKDNPTKYYINRGTEQGLNFDEFQSQILNQKIVVKYPEYWTPLDWNNSIRHISKVELNGKTLFNEFKQNSVKTEP